MNPPFALFHRVLAKLVKDKAHGVLIMPEWPTQTSFQLAKRLEVKSVRFECGQGIFERKGRAMSSMRWNVQAILVCGDRANCLEHGCRVDEGPGSVPSKVPAGGEGVLCPTPDPSRTPDEALVRALEEVRCMRLAEGLSVSFHPYVEGKEENGPNTEWKLEEESDSSDDELDLCVAERLVWPEATVETIKGVIEPTEPAESAKVEKLNAALFEEFGNTSLSGVCPVNPPVRGPYGEAEIWLKPDAQPVSVPPYRFAGERREAHARLIEEILQAGKIEPGRGSWNTPSFPVPKKKPVSFAILPNRIACLCQQNTH